MSLYNTYLHVLSSRDFGIGDDEMKLVLEQQTKRDAVTRASTATGVKLTLGNGTKKQIEIGNWRSYDYDADVAKLLIVIVAVKNDKQWLKKHERQLYNEVVRARLLQNSKLRCCEVLPLDDDTTTEQQEPVVGQTIEQVSTPAHVTMVSTLEHPASIVASSPDTSTIPSDDDDSWKWCLDTSP